MRGIAIIAAGLLALSACAAEPAKTPAPVTPAAAKPRAPGMRALAVPALPPALKALTARWQNEPVSNPPAQLLRYRVDGKDYYYRPAPCCDFYSELYDAAGQLVCHPDGGITGRGDGSCPGFREQAGKGELIWRDKRDRRMEKPAKP